MTDKWTLMMVLIAVVQLIVVGFLQLEEQVKYLKQ